MDYYEIPTWKEYQHYKDRHPPWIKLHTSLLTSNTWVMLDDASRVLAIACMLIASRTDGKVPNDSGYIKRVAYLSSVDFAPLISVGFLKPSSEMLASASTLQAKATTEERRGEDIYAQSFAAFWDAYPKKKAKADAQKAWRSARINGELGVVMSALEVQKRSDEWRKESGKYIPFPASWIRQRRWEDEQEEQHKAELAL